MLKQNPFKTITFTHPISNELCTVTENFKIKILNSDSYNFIFMKETGLFVRWGKDKDSDPNDKYLLPEIADIEISTVCSGVYNTPCKFCYKSNTSKGENMSIETFKKVFHNLPPTITQIAFGIGDIDGNKDMYEIFEYAKNNGIIPNVTINAANLTTYHVEKLSSICGAIAVSVYDKKLTYSAIKRLTEKIPQVNIHYMISEETYEGALELINDIQSNKDLEKLNALVFLSLKNKGRATKSYNKLSQEKFANLVNLCLEKDISFGFDSCSYYKFEKSILDKNDESLSKLINFAEPCESSLTSMYINVEGVFYPCSFTEDTEKWKDGLDIKTTTSKTFLNDIWYDPRLVEFRDNLISLRSIKQCCPIYDI